MTDPAVADDAQVIARVLAGDRDAFGTLVARHGRRIHDLARRMLRDAFEAEDVVQHAFLNAYRALPRYDPARPFRHWLLRITSNLCRNRLVARRHEPRGRGGEDDGEILPRIDPPARAETPPGEDERQEALRVRGAVEALPDAYRLVVILRYSQGLSLEEVAEITGQPLGTVKTHLHRARAVLARGLADPEAEQEPGAPPGNVTGARPRTGS